MAARPVLLYPNPILKEIAAPVQAADVERVADELLATIGTYERCVGIAAPQIGELVRVCVVNVSEHPRAETSNGLLVLANPRVIASEGSVVAREGCLSLPDVTANVRRATRIEVEHLSGTIECEGFEARAVLHEIDHLDGVLFLDRVESLVDDVFRRRSYAGGSGPSSPAFVGSSGDSSAAGSGRDTGDSSNASPGGRMG
ncbi:MAG: peptide deformylase [Actinomycetota bacterium]|nr:peptide deformylase [Actinomycetota bacterium]